MDRLEQIKNDVARENEYPDWNSASRHLEDNMPYRSCLETEGLVNEVARRYATEMVRHNLERAAEAATIETYEYNDYGQRIKVLDLGQEVNQNYIDYYATNKKSITSLEIELI